MYPVFAYWDIIMFTLGIYNKVPWTHMLHTHSIKLLTSSHEHEIHNSIYCWRRGGGMEQDWYIGILIRLGLNFDHAVTHNSMTRVLVLSDRVKKKEQLKWVVMADSGHWWYVRVNFRLQKITVILNQGIQSPKKIAILPISLFLHRRKFAPPYTSPNLAQNPLSDQVQAPLL